MLSSCSSLDDKVVSTYTVVPGDFKNILTVEGFVEPVRVTNIICPGNIDGVIIYLAEEGTIVEKGEIVCRIEDQDNAAEYEEQLVRLENAIANLSKTKTDLQMQYALLEAQVQNNEADTRIASLDSLQLLYATPSQRKIKELELEKVAIEKAKLQKKLEALEVIQQSDILKMELEIKRIQGRVDRVKDLIDKLEFKAPVDGLVIKPIHRITGKPMQVGDPVWTNMQLMTFPDMNEMKIKILASETDYKYMSVNDSVYYTFDAMPGIAGWGKITTKAPVGQAMNNSKVKYYEVEASIDSVAQMPEPGFTANCNIVIQQVKDTVYVPRITVFEQDSIKVVYVKKNKGFEMRQVLTGDNSPKEAIISAGLHAGEQVALSKPKSSMVKSTVLLPDSVVNREKGVETDGGEGAGEETSSQEEVPLSEMPAPPQ